MICLSSLFTYILDIFSKTVPTPHNLTSDQTQTELWVNFGIYSESASNKCEHSWFIFDSLGVYFGTTFWVHFKHRNVKQTCHHTIFPVVRLTPFTFQIHMFRLFLVVKLWSGFTFCLHCDLLCVYFWYTRGILCINRLRGLVWVYSL